jgi:hypothetical protein
MDGRAWRIERGRGPLVAAAIHNGHAVRSELVDLYAIGEGERLREEDPYTGQWTTVAPTRIVGLRSRFEVDFNRPRERAVYLCPEDAWGLKVWKRLPPEDVIERSRELYDGFHREVRGALGDLVKRFGRIVVFDFHSYNYRRAGPTAPPAAPEDNPEVIVATSNMDARRWAPVVDGFIEAMRDFDFLGRRLDVRQNVKFRGGDFPRWIHNTFPRSACCIAIETKKFFMDEWSGEADQTQVDAVKAALALARDRVLETLCRLQ